MGSPANRRDRYLSTYDWAGVLVRWEITERFDPATAVLLDVGAGWGKYRELLPEYEMDAVEIWRPYVEEERLEDRYRRVTVADVVDVELERYDAIIMGDVFEHLDVRQATDVLPRLVAACEELYVVVPFEYEQDAVNDNPYEVHRQADLTPEVMAERYAEWLRPLAFGDGKGIYVKNEEN